MAQVFISHVEEDRADAETIARFLEEAGISVWFYERDCIPGATYIDQIVAAIDSIHTVVLLISRKTLHSDQVDREVVRAFQRGKRILPVLKGLSFIEFQQLKPSWDHIIGASSALILPQGSLTPVLPRLLAGLRTETPPGKTEFQSARTVSDMARELRLTEAATLRRVREVLGIDVRTFSFVLDAQQCERLRTELSRAPAPALEKVRLDLGAGIILELVPIPEGRFVMGSPHDEEGHNDDEIQHDVIISKPYYLGRVPVTQAQWERVMGSNPSYFRGPQLPVEMVSWFEAALFCEELFNRFGKPFRLPTESEWEFACRAGTRTAFHTGSTITTDNANFDGKFTYANGATGITRWKTTDVGTFRPNAWGLHDMHGNVWEWCSDWYGEYGTATATDPQGPSKGDIRILRGGSWFHGPADCRSAQRDALDPGRRHSPYGFRVAMSGS
ncbi:MAG TPA: SUMF1/EgtB/PvdO family nonheme iron enzyme [Planctomycetota bacterium]|nr:SUMF1/EgtB/PvdO family nonheme iron enzyme [Planctomycetota bacterium]